MVCQGWMVTFIALWHLEDYSPWSAGEVSKALETFLEHKKEKNKNENDVKAFRDDDNTPNHCNFMI